MPLARCAGFISLCISVVTFCPRTYVQAAPRTVAGGTPLSFQSTIPRDPPRSCPVTRTASHSFVPPAPFPAKPGKDQFWFGSERLWTILSTDGMWHGLHTESAYGNKLFWYSLGLSRKEEGKRRVTVTGRRRDAGSPAFVTYADCCSSSSSGPHIYFMIAGVNIPSPGCWEITGDDQKGSVSFVVWVAP
jgi:hypothetical protein